MDSLTLFDDAPSEAPPADTATQLIPRATIADMVKRRGAALDAFARAYTAQKAANETMAEARRAHGAIDQRHKDKDSYLDLGRDQERHFLKGHDVPDLERFTETARKVVDRRMWSVLVEMTEMERLMDKQAKDALRRDLMENVPEATEDNIFATLQTFMADADMIFKRGIANCFSTLDRRFRSHDGWKVGSRIILDRCFDEWGSWSYHSNKRDTLHDIERAFGILDGLPMGAAGSIAQVVEYERRGASMRPRQSEHESPYFRIRCYQNGNAHLWFKREDLVAKVNKVLGEYYANPIPEERAPTDDGGLHTPKTSLAKNFGFYPTPDAAADAVIEYAPLYQEEGEPRLTVLEPSAGTGNLASRAAKKRATVDCVEYQAELCEKLNRAALYRAVGCADFLSIQPDPSRLYDRVIMNPPFDRERDIDHVMHALKFLKPDGCLVAVMSAGIEFRETRKSTAFRALMEKMHATWRDLPPASFASVGTYVNTVMVRVWNDGRKQSRW